jgi:SAM-dependent methyltransferase
MTSQQNLISALLEGRSYFGIQFAALQGNPARHAFFSPLAARSNFNAEAPVRILEIGSWAGASTVSWCRAFIDLGYRVSVDCVDPWQAYFDIGVDAALHYGRMNAACADDAIFRLFHHNLRAEGVDGFVKVLRGTSRQQLPSLPVASYDLIYIDGSHQFADVLFDLSEARRLLKPGGILCGDDLELQSEEVPADELDQMVAENCDYVSSSKLGSGYHPGVTKAVALELGRVSVWDGFWATTWDGAVFRPVEPDLPVASLPLHIQRALELAEKPTHIETLDDFRVLTTRDGFIALRSDQSIEIANSDLQVDIEGVFYFDATLEGLRGKVASQATSPQEAGFVSGVRPETLLVGSHREFNLVQHRDLIVCLDRALGPIDIPADPGGLVREFGSDKIVIATDVALARDLIDQAYLVRKVRAQNEGLRSSLIRTMADFKALSDEFAQRTKDIENFSALLSNSALGARSDAFNALETHSAKLAANHEGQQTHVPELERRNNAIDVAARRLRDHFSSELDLLDRRLRSLEAPSNLIGRFFKSRVRR